MANRQTDTKQKPDGQQTKDRKDLLDETVWESFPVSDPSGSWAGRDIPPAEKKN